MQTADVTFTVGNAIHLPRSSLLWDSSPARIIPFSASVVPTPAAERTAGPVGDRHGGAVPGRGADGRASERDRERPGVPARVERVPAGPAAADGGGQPGEAEDDPGRGVEHLHPVQPGRGDVCQRPPVEEPVAPY